MTPVPDRLLFFSQRFPPSVGGTPTVLKNLVSQLSTDQAAVVSMEEPDHRGTWRPEMPQARLKRPNKIIRKVDKRFFSLIPRFAFAGSRLVPRGDTKAVIGVFPYPAFALAAWFLARWRRAPFCLYMMDMWEDNAPAKGLERWFAKRYEPRIFATAHRIFCISESLSGHLRRKYPAQAGKIITLPHPMGLETDCLPEKKTSGRWKRPGEFLIVYTGQVYGCTADPIQTLVKGLDALADLNPRLIISTPDSEEALHRFGLLPHPRVSRVFLDSQDDVFDLQCEADLLFNPVSFTYPGRLQVETIFPTKTFEYLKTGKPMLVCGPEHAGFVQFARKKGIGTVLSSDDPEQLLHTIRRIAAGMDMSAQQTAGLKLLKDYSPQAILDILFREVSH
ncbi:MAG: glycosyltransferase [Lentisphaeria bacterium]|nr:glycosyltransferase [Lentisphaeria bacterium]